jgi:YYY domain-containing protein
MRKWWWALLAVVVIVGFVGRAWNLDFDQGQHLHPDERHWSFTSAALELEPQPDAHGTVFGPALDWLDGDRSPANPYRATDSFVYGPVMLSATRGAAGWLHDGVVNGSQPAALAAGAIDAIGIPLIAADGSPTFNAGYDVELIGRLLAALLDTLTIAVVGLIGRKLAGDAVGLFAAGFYASCVLAIQHAHFLGSEPLLGFFSALTVLAGLHLDRSSRIREAASGGLLLGFAAGAAMAAKLNAVGLIAVPMIGCVALVALHRRRSDLVRLGAVLLGSLIAFRFLHPAAFDGLSLRFSGSFVDDLLRVRAQSDLDFPPAIQWANRTPVVQPLVWLFRFTIGPGITIAAALGSIVLIQRFRKAASTGSARWPIIFTLAAVFVPFAYISVTSLPTGRYFIPMLPALCTIAGLGVVATWRWSSQADHLPRLTARILIGFSIVLAALWGAAFVNGVYGKAHTRIEATEWITEHIESGSVLSSQAWDDELPLALPGVDLASYQHEQLVMVGTDTETKINDAARQLGNIDYIVETSPRLWGVVNRIPARFPSTINFFDALDTGELGFERVATFANPPTLGWFSLDDSSAEEAFSVYDHPEVRIWKKIRSVEYLDLVDVLDPIAASNALTVTASDAHAGGLLLTDAESSALADGPTYAETFDVDGPSWAHAIGWFLLLELLGLAAFVLFLPLFRALPDAGLGIAKTLGLATPTFSLFVASAWFGVTLTRPFVISTGALMIAIAAGVARRNRADLRRLWESRRRTFAMVEGVSVAAFVGFLLLRASNPDLWHPFRGGEKPFELALLTSVLRTDTLPPYDAWFSGGVLNYYYGGYLLLLTPARLFSTSPALVMNIAPAVFASCAAGAAFSLGALATTGGRRTTRTGARPALAGIFAAFAVIALSSMAIFRFVFRWRSNGGPFDWWVLSRVIPDSTAITEFPAWSLLFADLHPHMMDITLVLSLGVVAVMLYRHLLERSTGGALSAAAMIGALIGLVRATNTWDFPLVVGVAAIALIAAALAGASWRLCLFAGHTIAAIVGIDWSPYARRGLVFDNGLDRTIESTPWSGWIEQFGLFVAVSLLVVVPVVARALHGSPRIWRQVRFALPMTVGFALLAVGGILYRPDQAVAVTTAALAGILLWAAWTSRRSQAGIPPLGIILLAIGWIIQTGVEIVTVRNDIGRQNTVFKFWYQSWLLLAVGAAVVIAASLPRRVAASRPRQMLTATSLVASVIAATAVVASATFWSLATPARVDDRISDDGLSLDGEAYLLPGFEVEMYDELIIPAEDIPLIDWLRSSVHGVRVVAEAPGEDYRWSGRVTWMTGLTSPIGWQFHERQQRRAYESAIDRRVTDLRELYTTTEPLVMARILADHEVDYLVFGTVERALSSATSASALRAFSCLQIETSSGDLFVATIDRSCVNELRPRG